IIVRSASQRNQLAKYTHLLHIRIETSLGCICGKLYAQRIQLTAPSSVKRCIAFCTAPTYTSCNSVLFYAQEGTCLLLSRAKNVPLLGGITPTLRTSALFFIILTCYIDCVIPNAYIIPKFREIAPIVYSAFNQSVLVYESQFHATVAGIRLRLWEAVDESQCLMICLDKFLADDCDAYYFSYGEKTCLTFRIRKIYALPNSPFNRHIIKFFDDGMLIKIVKDERLISIQHSNHITTEAKFKEMCTVQHSLFNRNSMDNSCSTICEYFIFTRLYKHLPLYQKLSGFMP
ncbi:putative PAN domain protein, partial [Trichinella spiralis]|uniref:putative PAN domain protein n=1 Tax=Trichinella spiralis TaxID=6334 RepID=UPI0001EFEDC8